MQRSTHARIGYDFSLPIFEPEIRILIGLRSGLYAYEAFWASASLYLLLLFMSLC